MKKNLFYLFFLLSLLFVIMAGCSSDDDDDDNNGNNNGNEITTTMSFNISITNLTSNQIFSPFAIIAHTSGYHAWQIGSASSLGLEILAEEGDPQTFIAEANANDHFLASSMGDSPTLPGSTTEIILELDENSDIYVTLASMLVNTNDAFTGLNAYAISDLEIQESVMIFAISYDAGTEDNIETQTSIPGPVAGGEGFNAARDDIVNVVTVHAGAITADEGLMNSVLDSSYKWDHPVAKIVISRLE